MGNPLFGTPADKALDTSSQSKKPTKQSRLSSDSDPTSAPATNETAPVQPPPYRGVIPPFGPTFRSHHYTPAAAISHASDNQIRRSLAFSAHAQQPHATPRLRSRLRRLAQTHADMAEPPATELDLYEALSDHEPSEGTGHAAAQPSRVAQPLSMFTAVTEDGRRISLMGVSSRPMATNPSAPSLSSSSSATATATSDAEGRRRTTFTGSITANGAGANTGAGVTRPKTEAELEADRRYEERIEEEYARMEGGA